MIKRGRGKTPYGEITPKQKRVLDWIRAFIAREGLAPSRVEIREGMLFASENAVQEHLNRLERQGWIAVERHRARAIRLLTPDPHRPYVRQAT